MNIDGALVSTDWLAENLEQANLRIFDTTVYLQVKADGSGYQADSGRDAWAKTHIPGAGFLDLIEEFSDSNNPIPFMMPSAHTFCDRAAAHGISDDSLVVYIATAFRCGRPGPGGCFAPSASTMSSCSMAVGRNGNVKAGPQATPHQTTLQQA